jgi:hypothetical protein
MTSPRGAIERILLSVVFWSAGCDGGDGGDGGDDDGAGDGGAVGDHVVIRTVGPYNNNAPERGVRVQVNDAAWQTTDADGEVVFSGVERPYSVLLAQNVEREVDRIVMRLIDRDDGLLVLPVFTTGDGDDEPTHFGSISGTIAGRSAEPESFVYVFARTMEDTKPVGEELEYIVVPPGDPFTLPPVTWWGEDTRSVTLHAIEAVPGGFSAAAKTVITLRDPDGLGATVTDVVLELTPVAQELVRGTVAMPDGLEDRRVLLYLAFEDGGYLLISGSSDFRGGEFELAFPKIEGASARLSFLASGPERGSSGAEIAVTPPVQDLDVTLPVPVELLEPASGAAIDADTTFRWAAAPGADLYSLVVRCFSVEYKMIETRDTQAVLPAIPDLDLPVGEACDWYVRRLEGPAFLLDTVERPALSRSASSASRNITFR